ncbi:MAG: amino acid adenylation domain-containing protein [Acidobacteriota bacterium]
MSSDLESKYRQALELASRKIREQAAEIEWLKRQEPIAIIGMGCRFPGGSSDPDRFWDLLSRGVCAVTEIPADRWDVEKYFNPDPEAPGTMYTRHGAFIDCVGDFDAGFFGITPREAEAMDPQQRLLLEVSWQALEDAGVATERIRGSNTGVFVGMTNDEYVQSTIHSPELADITPFAPTGAMRSTAAGRLSYTFDLHGPCLSTDTACSSSLVTLHQAATALARRECDLALAGGVNLMLSPSHYVGLCKVKALSADGVCRAFAAGANGYVRGEGCGMVVLKRLPDAHRDRDRILAVIRGSAVNHDGRSNGLTAPNGPAQEAVIRAACRAAGVDPSEIGYFEAHGTGTELGDPIEILALARVLKGRKAKIPVGSVKTNIGHLEAAAGVAGLVKAVLALRHEEIPRSLNFDRPNPHVDWESTPLAVASHAVAWKRQERSRLAAISSFGFSGTNAHVIIEEAPPEDPTGPRDTTPCILPLSARAPEAMAQLAEAYGDMIVSGPDPSLPDLCFTAALGRTHFEHRRAFIGATREEMVRALQDRRPAPRRADKREPAFLFAGQGSEYAGMGRQLYESNRVFHDAVEECRGLVREYAGRDIVETVLLRDRDEEVREADYVQPCLFAIQYGLLRFWRSCGVEPAAVCGYSLGEFAAAYAAGIMTLRDCLQVICEASQQIIEKRPLGLLSVAAAPVDRVRPLLDRFGEPVEIAGNNSPWSVTLSGPVDAVRRVAERLAAERIECFELPFKYGFHSALVDPLLARFRDVVPGITFAAMRIPFYSTIFGRVLGPKEVTGPDYWIPHIRSSVQFRPALESMISDGYDLFLECDPGDLLINFGRQTQKGSDEITWLTSLSPGRDGGKVLLESLGRLYEQGIEIDWGGVEKGRKVAVPGYPFQRKTYWLSGYPDRVYDGRSSKDGRATFDDLLGELPEAARGLAGDPECRAILETQYRSLKQVSDRSAKAMRQLIRRQVEILSAARARTKSGAALAAEPIVVPVTSVQRRLYAIAQQDGGEMAYHLPESFWIDGPLDADLVERYLGEVVARHESLRTGFRIQDEDLVQVIEPAPAFSIERREAEEARIDEALAAAIRPFDLARPPLFRAILFKTGPERHLLLLDSHHIIMDFTSFIVLMEEMMALYEGRLLPPVAIQYRDSMRALDAHGRSERMERQQDYWLKQLSGDLPVLELPLDQARPARPTHGGGHVFRRVAPELTAGLRELARETETTLFMVLLAAYSVLLHRLTGQEEVLVGIPVGGRNLKETRHAVGMFVNSLVARQKVNGGLSVRKFVGEVKRTCLELYDNQDYPFSSLVEKLAPPTQPGRNMMFDTMIELDVATATAFRAAGLDFTYRKVHHRAAICDLVLQVLEHPDELLCDFSFATDLFREETIARWSGSLETILAGFVGNPEETVGRIEARSEDERKAWEGLRLPSRSIPAEATIHALFAKQAALTPDATAIVCGDERWSYREVDECANRMAHALRTRCDIQPDEMVALLLDRSELLVVAILAVLKAGAAYVPIDPESPRARIEFILEDSCAKALIAEPRFLDLKTPSMRAVIDVRAPFGGPATSPDEINLPSHLAYVIYTSGTTGNPKGCLITHHNVVRLMRGTEELFGFRADDVWTLFHSYAFDFSVWEIWGALLYGGTLVIVPYGTSRSPEAFRALVARDHVTVLNQTPAAFRQYIAAEMEQAPIVPQPLRLVIFGGEALEFAMLKPWFDRYGDENPRLVNMYGITETTVHVTHRRVRASDAERRASLIGTPLPDLGIQILDASARPALIGATGEIHVSGGGLARGYHRRPDLTRERFVPDPFQGGSGVCLYKTGDLGRYLPGGDIEYLGRADRQVKIRGFRIECGEVEAALHRIDGVREAVVVAVDEGTEKVLAAYCVADTLDTAAMRSELGRVLPGHMIPSYLVRMDRFPLTSNGKLDRKALPDPRTGHSAAAARSYDAPQGESETILAGIWKELLRVERVSRHDNFIELGGDSIKAIQAVARCRRLNLAIRVPDLLGGHTVATLAKVIGAPAAAPASVSATGAWPLTPIQRWFFASHVGTEHHFNQAVLLTGRRRLDAAILERALGRVIGAHDIFRTRFRREGAGWIAMPGAADEPARCHVHAIKGTAAGDDAIRIILQLQASLNIETGPLIRTALLRGAERDTLLIVIHHLAVDGVSWRILVEDLETACRHALRDEEIRFDAPTDSFATWASRLSSYAAAEQLSEELPVWQEILSGPCDRLPLDRNAETNLVRDCRAVQVQMPREETGLLLHGRQARTQELLLAALSRALHRWRNLRSVLVMLEGHGRQDLVEGCDVTRTVGWFTSLYPIRLETPDDPDCRVLLRSIKSQLERVPNQGAGFGILRFMRARAPDTAFLDADPEIVFNYLGDIDMRFEDSIFEPVVAMAPGTIDPRSRRNHLLEIDVWIRNDRLETAITYNARQFDHASVESLASSFGDAMGEIAAHLREQNPPHVSAPDQDDHDRLIASCGLAGEAVQEIYPLMPLQAGMLYHSQADERYRAYLQQMTLHLSGPLDPDALACAFQETVDRHEALRTLFSIHGTDSPLQVVLRQRRAAVTTTHLEDSSDSALDRVRNEDLSRGFDLQHDPLMRLRIVSRGADHHAVVFTFHHIILDGWSFMTVLRDLFGGYGRLAGRRVFGVEAPVSLSRFIEWYRRRDGKGDLEYWRQTLAGFDAERLPLDSLRSEAGGRASVRHRVTLSQDLTRRLLAATRERHATLSSLVQCAWALVLARHSGLDDIVVGMTVSGRPAEVPGVDKMAGLFINTLPMRYVLDDEISFADFLARTHAALTAAQERQSTPLGEIMAACRLNRLIDHAVVFENYPLETSLINALQAGDLGFRIDGVDELERTNFDLVVVAYPGASLIIEFTFNGEALSSELVDRFGRDFGAACALVAERPEIPLAEILARLAPAEEQLEEARFRARLAKVDEDW